MIDENIVKIGPTEMLNLFKMIKAQTVKIAREIKFLTILTMCGGSGVLNFFAALLKSFLKIKVEIKLIKTTIAEMNKLNQCCLSLSKKTIKNLSKISIHFYTFHKFFELV